MIKIKEKSIKQATTKDKLMDTSSTSRIKQKPNKEESNDASKSAIKRVEQVGTGASLDTARRAKSIVRKKYHEYKATQTEEKAIFKNKNHLIYNNTRKPNSSFIQNINQKIQTDLSRKLAVFKYQKKVFQSSNTVGKIRFGLNAVYHTLGSIFSFTKKSITNIKNIFGMMLGLIVMVVLVCFIGVFASLSDDSTVNSATEPLSIEVIEYRDTIEKYAKQYDLEEYVSLIQAVMMNESAGKGNDPMQSSLLEHNTVYPKIKDGIANAEYSIDVGVHYLSDCFKLAEVEGPYDMERISLMLQGYNYGKEYIIWAKEYFDGYTRANAKVYSDEKRAELQVDSFGDPKYVGHVLRYYHLGNGDIVMVAKTQIGNIGGKPYWKWYGFNNRVEWCAIFVSWCANESGQLNTIIPQFSVVNDGIDWYKEKGLWIDKKYIPKAGDLIFFDWENDGSPDHVGIVEKVQDNNIFTIEGNSNDECRERCYRYAQNCIYGYGIVEQ